MPMCGAYKTTVTPPSFGEAVSPDYTLRAEELWPTGKPPTPPAPPAGTVTPPPGDTAEDWVASSCNPNAKYRYAGNGQIEVAGRGVPMPATVPERWSEVEKWQKLIWQVADSQGVSRALLAALVLTESGGDANARGDAGELGLLQLMPDVARRVANPRFPQDETPVEVADHEILQPAWNLSYGTKWLVFLLNRYQGNLISTLNSFNHGRVECGTAPGCPVASNYWGVWTNCGYVDRVIENLNFAVSAGYAGPVQVELGEGGAELKGSTFPSLLAGLLAGGVALFAYSKITKKGGRRG